MNVRIQLCGSYPRKEDLVKTTWNFDKGLVDQAGLDAAYAEATNELVERQRRLGFDPVTDGNLAWQDAFRPLVETSPGLEVGGVTRLFETNKFFRQPIVNGEPRLDWKRLEKRFPHATNKAKAAWKAILPSPYWLTRVAKDNHYHDEKKLGTAFATYVNEVAKKLEGAGYKTIQFQEAFLFYEPKPDLAFAKELLTRALQGLKVETLLNFPNGNAGPYGAFLAGLPSTAVGIDFIETRVEDLPKKPFGKPIAAQVVDSQESLVESPTEVRTHLERVQKHLQPTGLVATHTWDLEFVPDDVAQRKLAVLAQVLPKAEVAR